MDWLSISVGWPSRNLPNNKLLKAGLWIANKTARASMSSVFPGLPTLNIVLEKQFSVCRWENFFEMALNTASLLSTTDMTRKRSSEQKRSESEIVMLMCAGRESSWLKTSANLRECILQNIAETKSYIHYVRVYNMQFISISLVIVLNTIRFPGRSLRL